MRLWLASASPRRRELLEWAGYDADVHPADLDESRAPGTPPVAHAEGLAARKAATGPADRVVVAADTVVHQGDDVLDKPRDAAEAMAHLRRLAGAWHVVTTGVCVRHGAWSRTWSVSTRVRFRELSDTEIAAYVATGEAADKAGAYGIQGRGGALVAALEGSWTNVKGLPLEETLAALRAAGALPRWEEAP